MKISVVVPAFNEERGLAASLRAVRGAVAALEDRGWAWEFIVCDNNSTDRTAAIAREHGADVVFEPINQISRARNTGAARATGDWLVFVDADSHPSRELFAEMARVIQEGRCLAGGSTVRVDAADILSTFFVGCWNVISRLTRWAAGSFIFCEAPAFREIGGFSLEFYAAEEIDLSRRLKRLARRRGRTFVILPDHPLRTSARKKDLYTPREHLTFMLKTAVLGGRTLRSPEQCYQWYDGRR
ncbi:MAG: glycosyltransferase [Acidobacteria bacterium]|nr:glycosyltransferase [Acidobacteriota bacterium]